MIVRQGIKALATISHEKVTNLIVALKPEVLELYRKEIRQVNTYMTSCEVTFDDKDQIKNILQSYGQNIDRYNKIYQEVTSKDLDNITNAIYDIERTPSFVRLFYEILTEIVEKAEKYPEDKYDFDKMISHRLSRSTEFYKTQIDTLLNKRSNEAIFLYTIKLFYELGFERTYENIRRLQKEIFDSKSPQNPFKDLSTWIFPSTGYGLYYSMLDLPKDSINYTIDMVVNIMNYLTVNFQNLVNEQKVNLIYNLGYFIGKNIKFVRSGSNSPLLPNQMYEHIIIDFTYTKKYHFLRGICDSISEKFGCFDNDTQQRILKLVSMEAEFGPLNYYLSYFLGLYLGSIFSTLDSNLQQRLLTTIQTSKNEFSKRLIWALAVRFSSIDKEFQKKILELIGQRSELSYLGVYIMSDFALIDREIQEKILELIETRNEFASWFASLMSIFPDLDIEIQRKVLELGEKKKDIAPILITLDFPSLIQVQEQVLKIAEDEKANIPQSIIISKFAERFDSMDKEFRQKVLESAGRSISMGALLGSALSNKLNSFDEDLREEIEKAARQNVYFAQTLGLDEIVKEINRQQLENMTDDERQKLRMKAKEIAEKYSQKRRGVRETVMKSCQSWPYSTPEIINGRDLNPVDTLHIAETFRKFCHLDLWVVTLSTPEALRIVDLVETELQTQISHGIRNTSLDDLINSLTILGTIAVESYPELGSIEEAIMKSLYLWFGCVQIDKSCRLTDAHGNAFDTEQSMKIHSELVELSKSNPWIKKGFTSAKSFRQEQRMDKTYDWIPRDSPYWEE